MADEIKISALPVVISPLSTDIFPVVQSGVTKKETVAQAFSAVGGVAGPGSATDTAIARFNGTTGKIIENSLALLDNSGNLTGLSSVVVQDLTLSGFVLQSISSLGLLASNGNGVVIGPNGATGFVGIVSGTSSGTIPLRFYNSTGTNYTALQAGTLSGNSTYTLPTAIPGSTQALISDNTGAMSFSNFVASVSGTATRISSTGGNTPVIDLINTAVTPGSYTKANITVDAAGRITAASNGSPNLFQNGYLYGLGLVYSSNLNATEFTLNQGQCVDSTNSFNISLGSNTTQKIYVSGVVNGLDTGSYARGSLYAVYVIADSTGSNPTGGLSSLSFTSPALPTGYNIFRRVGYFYTSSAPNLNIIYYFTQAGDVNDRDYLFGFYTDKIILNGGTATTQTSIGSLSSFVPPSVGSIKLIVTFTPQSASDTAFLCPAGALIASNYFTHIFGTGQLGAIQENIEIMPGTSFEIDYLINRTGAAGSTLTIGLVGFKDVI